MPVSSNREQKARSRTFGTVYRCGSRPRRFASCRCGGEDVIAGELGRIVAAAAEQEPALPARIAAPGQRHAAPVVELQSLGAFARRIAVSFNSRRRSTGESRAFSAASSRSHSNSAPVHPAIDIDPSSAAQVRESHSAKLPDCSTRQPAWRGAGSAPGCVRGERAWHLEHHRHRLTRLPPEWRRARP